MVKPTFNLRPVPPSPILYPNRPCGEKVYRTQFIFHPILSTGTCPKPSLCARNVTPWRQKSNNNEVVCASSVVGCCFQILDFWSRTRTFSPPPKDRKVVKAHRREEPVDDKNIGGGLEIKSQKQSISTQ